MFTFKGEYFGCSHCPGRHGTAFGTSCRALALSWRMVESWTFSSFFIPGQLSAFRLFAYTLQFHVRAQAWLPSWMGVYDPHS